MVRINFNRCAFLNKYCRFGPGNNSYGGKLYSWMLAADAICRSIILSEKKKKLHKQKITKPTKSTEQQKRKEIKQTKTNKKEYSQSRKSFTSFDLLG